MAQIQAHQGYFHGDGQLVFDDLQVKPPRNTRVTVLWEAAEDEPALSAKQREVVLRVSENLRKFNEELLMDEETQASFDAFDRGEFRVRFPNRIDDRLDADFNEVQA